MLAVFTTLGAPNLDVAVRFRSIKDVARLEAAVVHNFPDLKIVERLLVMRLVKWGGQVIDKNGFATSYVPIDIRKDPVRKPD